ncbi:MAG TPA: SDR family oxidoreductase [Solirubrobacterales bacterium]|nr:SDR family oxidoreductase [Solirubrobacterales bacterium]
MALPPPSDSSTALVTGASAGIGVGIARELASRGQGVVLVARREDRLRALASELAGDHGVRAEPIAADLADADARDRLADRIDALGLAVEVLVNNAGFGSTGSLWRAEPRRMVEMVRLNCEAYVDLQARYSAEMVERERGAVINVASTAAFQPMPGTATYGATKAFVVSLSEATHSELSGRGVTVTAVCPGPVKTEFGRAAGVAGAERTLPGLFWTDVADVAREAVEGADDGRRVVVVGTLNRAGAIAGRHAPRMIALPIVKNVWGRAT